MHVFNVMSIAAAVFQEHIGARPQQPQDQGAISLLEKYQPRFF